MGQLLANPITPFMSKRERDVQIVGYQHMAFMTLDDCEQDSFNYTIHKAILNIVDFKNL